MKFSVEIKGHAPLNLTLPTENLAGLRLEVNTKLGRLVLSRPDTATFTEVNVPVGCEIISVCLNV